MFQKFNGIAIEFISSCVPSGEVDNSFFQSLLSEKEIKMFEKTVGIFKRRWASEEVTASDLGYQAAIEILNVNNLDKEKIKGLVFLSQTSDYKIPFTSNILQNRLGLKNDILCLDINAGCAGFIQGLSIAYSIVNTLNKGEKVLLIIGETLSKILSPYDRSTSMLFGDGASAILISKTENSTDESFFNFFSDGSKANAIMIPDGGYRNGVNENSFVSHSDEKNNQKSKVQLSMDGPSVFDFTLREIYPSILQLLTHFNIDLNVIDKFLFHQSNKFIIKQIAAKLGIEGCKVPINIHDFGNTSGVSIPLLISSFHQDFLNTNKILCSGYGSGLTWGNCLLDISNTEIFPIKIYKV